MAHSVLIIQQIVPHYRALFFERLAKSSANSFTVAYGTAAAGASLESVDQVEDVDTARLTNYYLPLAITCQRGLVGLVRSGRFDTIIAEFNPRVISNVVICEIARRMDIPFIWWGHGLFDRPSARAYASAARLVMARMARAVIFYSHTRAREAVLAGLPSRKAFVARNTLVLDAALTREAGESFTQRFRILHIGRLVADKKVSLAIEAFAIARDRLPSATVLTLIGDGPERDALRSLSRRLGVGDRVEFAGAVAESCLPPFLGSSWVCVSPGRIGLNAVHSLAYGVPLIVAEDEPHSPEIELVQYGTNALPFSSNDAHSLAAQLIGLSSDRDKAQEMGVNGRRRVASDFSVETMIRGFDEAIVYAHSSE